MGNDDNIRSAATSGGEMNDAIANPTDARRREMLRRLGKAAIYATPVTMATLSMKASACSMTC